MTKIPFNRLKIAQINRKDLPEEIAAYCLDNAAFEPNPNTLVAHGEDMEVLIYADLFAHMDSEVSDEDYGSSIRHKLNDLNKQFISFDYIMII